MPTTFKAAMRWYKCCVMREGAHPTRAPPEQSAEARGAGCQALREMMWTTEARHIFYWAREGPDEGNVSNDCICY